MSEEKARTLLWYLYGGLLANLSSQGVITPAGKLLVALLQRLLCEASELLVTLALELPAAVSTKEDPCLQPNEFDAMLALLSSPWWQRAMQNQIWTPFQVQMTTSWIEYGDSAAQRRQHYRKLLNEKIPAVLSERAADGITSESCVA